MPTYLQFKVTLCEIEPAIWRRFLLRADTSFAYLHEAIQHACGWQEMHLFRFFLDRPYGKAIAAIPDDEDGPLAAPVPDAKVVPLLSYFDDPHVKMCGYLYDYGDDWVHEVVLEERVEVPDVFFRKLLGGERAFPPENSGGVSSYETCVRARNLPQESDPDLVRWLGRWDPERFDLTWAAKKFDRARRTRLCW